MFEFAKKKNKKDTKKSSSLSRDIPQIVRLVQDRYEESKQSKSEEVTKWKQACRAYTGEEFKKNVGKHRSNMIVNYIHSTVETIKPIMFNNQPKPLVFPCTDTEENFAKAMCIQEILDYEFTRTDFVRKNLLNLTNSLVCGTGILGIFWNEDKNNVEPVVISPFNFFIDPLATTIEDADYVMYATYKSIGQLTKLYPEHAKEFKTNTTDNIDSDLNSGEEVYGAKNQILCIECYMRDHTTKTYFEDEVNKDTGETETYKVEELKYPRGRRVLIAGDILLEDGENPYEHGQFPFESFNAYDIVGKFWGMSEAEQIIPINKEINELYDDIIDSAHITSNPIWIVDDNSGVPMNSLSNRKGLVIRKRRGTDVRREQPPSMPSYINQTIDQLAYAIQNVSGVFDATRGERPASVTSGVAIQALQESSQGRIKLKTQKLENMLARISNLWLRTIQQYWDLPRTIRITNKEYFPNSIGRSINGETYYFADVTGDEIDGDYDIMIKSGSTMPTNKSANAEMILRLAQTPAEDGKPMVGRREVMKAFAEMFDNPDEIISRYEQQNAQEFQQQQEENTRQQVMADNIKKEQMDKAHQQDLEKEMVKSENSNQGIALQKIVELLGNKAQGEENKTESKKEKGNMENNTLQNKENILQSNQIVENETQGQTPAEWEQLSLDEFVDYVISLDEATLNKMMADDERFAYLVQTIINQANNPEGNSQGGI